MPAIAEKAWAGDLLERLCAGEGDPRPRPATLVVVAHPDDEVIGAGARLAALEDVTIVHVTDGAPRDGRDAKEHALSVEQYAHERRREAEEALGLVGIGPERMLQLGCADQNSSHCLVELTQRLSSLVLGKRPEAVLTHPYEGGHPDHDATAFIVHAACRLLEGRGARTPTIIEMTSYHRGRGGIESSQFLPGGPEAITCELDEKSRGLKQRMLACFRTQQETLKYFDVARERFRLAPRYGFGERPHEGRLFYEDFCWGVSGDEFCERTREALAALALEGAI